MAARRHARPEHAEAESLGVDEVRLTAPVASSSDDDPALRPRMLADFVGQPRAKRVLSIALDGARGRSEALDHLLLYGPPGLGKTTLATIVANEMGGGFRAVSAPAVQRPGDLAALLVSLSPFDVLFIDEIHRLSAAVEEVLYSAMEDFRLDIMAGDPGRPQAVTIPLPRFTLVGATTRSGMLARPLRDRFGLDVKLDLYAPEDLATVAARSAGLLGVGLGDGVAGEIAARSRGTPRIANRLLRRLRDYAQAARSEVITKPIASSAFDELEVDGDGLDALDRRYLEALGTRFRGRPVGIATIAAALGEDSGTLEDEVEPWLVQRGLVDRTPRGRVLGEAAQERGQQQLL